MPRFQLFGRGSATAEHVTSLLNRRADVLDGGHSQDTEGMLGTSIANFGVVDATRSMGNGKTLLLTSLGKVFLEEIGNEGKTLIEMDGSGIKYFSNYDPYQT